MKEDWQETTLNRFYVTLPLLVSALLTALSYLPLKSSLADNARPEVGLMCIYFWLIYRPDLFNLGVVFFFGIFCGLLSAAPFGCTLLSFLVMYLLVTSLIKYLNGRLFVVLWMGAAVLMLVALIVKWGTISLFYGQTMPVVPLIFSYLVSLAFYPIVSGVNALVLNIFLQED